MWLRQQYGDGVGVNALLQHMLQCSQGNEDDARCACEMVDRGLRMTKKKLVGQFQHGEHGGTWSGAKVLMLAFGVANVQHN